MQPIGQLSPVLPSLPVLPEELILEPESRSQPKLPPGVPVEAIPFLQEVGYLEPDALRVGDPAPDVPFYTPEGETLFLSRFQGLAPVVLVFGSHT
ncbi:MAG TPA: hypothetical protein VK689_08665 [Armatimonadota bacterium]|nr:hypothetical protein [Armatimonadota bacterium]